MKTQAEILLQIASISEFLKGSGIDFQERLACNEERKQLRAELAASIPGPSPFREGVLDQSGHATAHIEGAERSDLLPGYRGQK